MSSANFFGACDSSDFARAQRNRFNQLDRARDVARALRPAGNARVDYAIFKRHQGSVHSRVPSRVCQRCSHHFVGARAGQTKRDSALLRRHRSNAKLDDGVDSIAER